MCLLLILNGCENARGSRREHLKANSRSNQSRKQTVFLRMLLLTYRRTNTQTSLPMRSSISGIYASKAGSEVQGRKTLGNADIRKSKVESKLFENDKLYFYIEESTRKKLHSTIQSLINHSANVIKSLEFVKSKEIQVTKLYCVLPDGYPGLFASI